MSRISRISKQRALAKKIPLHLKHHKFHARLSDDLRIKYNVKSLAVRRNDTVRIISGIHKGTEGRVNGVKDYKLYIDGVSHEKADGSDTNFPIDPSNVIIVRLARLDSHRKRVIQRKAGKEIEFPEEEEEISTIETEEEVEDLSEEEEEEIISELEGDLSEEKE
ncbi:MAG: 50S ribosomal protein L24 [Promethearchaeota archaeon]